jgi:hypothetical protein
MSGSHSPSAPELPGDSTQRSAIAAEYAQPTPVPVQQLRLWPGVVIVDMDRRQSPQPGPLSHFAIQGCKCGIQWIRSRMTMRP